MGISAKPLSAGRAAAAVLACAGLAASPAWGANAPSRVAPDPSSAQQRRAARRARDFSEGGSRRGGLELALASATTVVTGVVIGRGVWELQGVEQTREDCAQGSTALACSDPDTVGRDNRIAAVLSFGFAVPLGIAAGWLFARAARTRRDYAAWRRSRSNPSVSALPWATPAAAGVVFRLRF